MVGSEDYGESLNQTHYEDLLMTRVFRRRWTLLIQLSLLLILFEVVEQQGDAPLERCRIYSHSRLCEQTTQEVEPLHAWSDMLRLQ